MKGYKPNSTFNSKVWFLKDDQSFQSLVQNKTPYSSTPKPNNKIIEFASETKQIEKFILSVPKIKSIQSDDDKYISDKTAAEPGDRLTQQHWR